MARNKKAKSEETPTKEQTPVQETPATETPETSEISEEGKGEEEEEEPAGGEHEAGEVGAALMEDVPKYVIESSTEDPPVFNIIVTETGEKLNTDPFVLFEEAEAYLELQIAADAGAATGDETSEVGAGADETAETVPTPPETTEITVTADLVSEEDGPVWRYQRKEGYPPTEVEGTTYFPGQVYTANKPNTIPKSFLDGWKILNNPQPDGKAPYLAQVVGGFDLYSVAGRKLNDTPITAEEAEELLGGINS